VRLPGAFRWGGCFVLLTILYEGALLVVAAQAGLLAGPRVLANMAVDSWAPRRFAALSDRFDHAEWHPAYGDRLYRRPVYTRGRVSSLVVMYCINVFLTFSLSMFAMLRYWLGERKVNPLWRRRAALFATGLAFCVTILAITTVEKFTQAAGSRWW
jgi:amino acid permease